MLFLWNLMQFPYLFRAHRLPSHTINAAACWFFLSPSTSSSVCRKNRPFNPNTQNFVLELIAVEKTTISFPTCAAFAP